MHRKRGNARERSNILQIQISLLLDRSRADTLTSQLVSQLRDAIRVGRIATGVRLPSSRRLSEQLGIGRNTVVRAYETLEMECYVELRPASGMFATVPPFDARAVHRPSDTLRMAAAVPKARAPMAQATAGSSAGAAFVRLRTEPSECGAIPAEDLATGAANLSVAGGRSGFDAAG